MFDKFFTANIYDSLSELIFNVQLKDVFDIFIITFSIYLVLVLFQRIRSLFLFNGLLVLFAVYLVAKIFNLYLTSLLFQFFFAFFFIIMAIVFQKELRSLFEMISAPEKFKRILGIKIDSSSEATIDTIIKAAAYLAHNKTGALMVLPGSQPVGSIIEGGTELNGKISLSLLLSIFDDSSPGHDGAVIIKDDQIRKFGAHLPLAERFMKFGDLGTRHRAALGMATASDALVVVVSEERGQISVARSGDLRRLPGVSELKSELSDFFGEKKFYTARDFLKDFTVKNVPQKISAFVLACILWFALAYQPGVTARTFEVPLDFRALPKDIIVTKVEPSEISLTLSGGTQEFKLLNEDNLKITVDASKFVIGSNYIEIKEKDISRPSSFNIADFSPSAVEVITKVVETPTPVPSPELISGE